MDSELSWPRWLHFGAIFLASGTFGAPGRFLSPMIHYPRGPRPSSIDSPRNGAYSPLLPQAPLSPDGAVSLIGNASDFGPT